MLFLDSPADALAPRSAMLAAGVVLREDDGQAPNPAPPYGAVSLQGPGGPLRLLAHRGAPGEIPGGLPGELAGDPIELAESLDPESCRRLLGFLLGFCRTAFALSAEPRFAAVCLRLARLCAHDAGPVRVVAEASPAWVLLEGMRAEPDAVCYALSADRVRPLASHPAGPTRRLTAPVRDGEALLAMGERPALWAVRRPGGALPDMLRPGAPPAARLACLQALAPAGGAAASLAREAQVLSPAAPRRLADPSRPLGAALDAALPDGEGGLFLSGWLRDPLNLVESAAIETPGASAALDPAALHRVRRPDIVDRYSGAAFADDTARLGFVAHAPDPSGGLCAQPTLVLRLRSGALVRLTAPLRTLQPGPARNAVLSCAAPEDVSPAMLDACLAPAAAALHRQALARRGAADVVAIGTPPRAPETTIIVPYYRCLDFVRFQMAGFAADPECRRAELIHVLDSPEQAGELEHLLRGLHGLHQLASTLVVMPANAGYAAANNEAARRARGAALLLLNSDVVPARPGWLGTLRAGLAPGVGAVGPKLLFDDASIQHAGLYFERDAEGAWFNAHYHKGMPRRWPAAQRRRRVPGVTGAALLVRRALFEAVGGFTEDYIIGDYEDSDLCLKLRAAGAAIGYVPEAELFHFERRSIQLHAGYARTLASLYNRRLHHRRWDAAMTELMTQRGFRSAA